MSNSTISTIAVVTGIVLFVPAFVISPGLAIVLAFIVVGAAYVITRAIGNSETRVKKDRHSGVLDRMWIPVRDELSEVVRMGGRVTAASSVWTGVPNLYKQETPATFHQGMERYVNKRAQVAPLVASASTTEENRQRQEMEQQDLLLMSRELLEEARTVINSIPGSETAVSRAAASRAAPSAQQTSSAARRPSAVSGVGTRQPSPVSRSSQAQTATPSRTMQPRPTPPRPAPAPMRAAEPVSTPRPPRPAAAPSRITDTPSSPEPVVPSPPPRPSPTPMRITDTPAPPEPVVPPPAPREPVPAPPPSPPPVPTPASVPEVMEEIKSPEPAVTAPTPEPAVTAPSPNVPEPVTTPSASTGDVPLDVASVCEDLFSPDMMSYQTNRLFDDRYKDATVRWKGTARRASAYSYDFNFGDGGGTKAELDVYEVKQQYGSRTVKAVVQLPVEAADGIGARIGEEIEFEGRLMTCEGSARRVYVADARMVD